MTTPFWCLLVAVLLPYVLAFTGAGYRKRELGSLDNRNPRAQVQQLSVSGTAARCYAAQQNAWEALAVFSAAVLVAHLGGADPRSAATASLVFVAARVLHAVCYIADQDKLRSLAFMVGFGCCIWLFALAM